MMDAMEIMEAAQKQKRKKRFFKVRLVLGLLLVPAVLLFFKDSNGNSLFSVEKLSATFDKVKEKSSPAAAQEEVVYKWQDENGHWQFSNTPQTNPKAEKILVRTDTNIISSEGFRDESEESGTENDSAGSSDLDDIKAGLSTLKSNLKEKAERQKDADVDKFGIPK